MSSIEELPPDQRAALSLLLRQGQRHDDVAGMLGIEPQAVHDRAHAALAVLAPAQARQLGAAEREEIGEYLLGQQDDAGERLRTRTLLSSSPAAGEWARAVAAQLETLAPGAVPEVPAPAGESAGAAPQPPPAQAGGVAGEPSGAAAAGDHEAASAFAGEGHPRPSSRIGGALLLAAIVAAVVVVIIVVSDGGSSHKKGSTTTKTSASSNQPKAEGRITMHPPNPASNSTGTVQILSEGEKKAFFIVAEHIPSTSGKTFYAVWLYNSPSSALALSKSPPVGASHKLSGAALLPSNASDYKEILLTRETSLRPTRPGPIVLRGHLNL
jgi:hypothetical protein